MLRGQRFSNPSFSDRVARFAGEYQRKYVHLPLHHDGSADDKALCFYDSQDGNGRQSVELDIEGTVTNMWDTTDLEGWCVPQGDNIIRLDQDGGNHDAILDILRPDDGAAHLIVCLHSGNGGAHTVNETHTIFDWNHFASADGGYSVFILGQPNMNFRAAMKPIDGLVVQETNNFLADKDTDKYPLYVKLAYTDTASACALGHSTTYPTENFTGDDGLPTVIPYEPSDPWIVSWLARMDSAGTGIEEEINNGADVFKHAIRDIWHIRFDSYQAFPSDAAISAWLAELVAANPGLPSYLP